MAQLIILEVDTRGPIEEVAEEFPAMFDLVFATNPDDVKLVRVSTTHTTYFTTPRERSDG